MTTQKMSVRLKTLVLAMGVVAAGTVQADTNTEVEQLRKEVQELRGMLEQYAQQQKQMNTQQQNYQVQATAQPAPAKPVAEKKGFGITVGGAEVNFYGNVRADATYQIDGGPSRAHPYNQINKAALDGAPGNSDLFKSTLAATRLGFDFKTPTQAGDVAGKVEVDFLGSNDTLRIRHAYLTYANWLIGQTWSNFAVPDYMPETIDALGYVGGAVKRTPQVRYTSTFSPETNLIFALEDSKYSDNSGTTLGSDPDNQMRIPALTARLNHKFANNAGIISARTMVADKQTSDDEKVAWGVGLGTKYNVTPSTTLKADYYHVKGDSSFVSWSNPGYSIEKSGGNIQQSEFGSITVGITQQFNPKWRGTLGYGYMTHDEDLDYINASANPAALNKDLWQAWANVFYSPIKPVSLGLEYTYGERETFSTPTLTSKTGEENRVNVVALYNF
ncbi:DcaP family trimeric outer membrane transporter [Acinetobacter sp. PK01]|uniref:DcaP family trimeric outer membrane transporter n=1 Tax=Acinetobacter sp. PK01 TaxID=2930198 RepID=UPI001FB66286|nr:DcaP family trimeric outer membrane transporter [Acinetobacter sp. PK01]UOG16768.1 porin [Acinetobacter sp. PK01]